MAVSVLDAVVLLLVFWFVAGILWLIRVFASFEAAVILGLALLVMLEVSG